MTFTGRLNTSWYKQKYFLCFLVSSILFEVHGQQKVHDLLHQLEMYPQTQHDSIYFELFKSVERSDIENSKHYAFQSLQLSEQYNHPLIASKSCLALGNIFRKQNEIDSALLYYHKAIRIGSLNGFDQQLMYFYNSLGSLFERTNAYDSALFYYTQSHDLAVQLAAPYNQAVAQHNMALIHYHLENKKQALVHFSIALKLTNRHGGIKGEDLSTMLLNMASIYNDEGEFNQAISYLESVEKNCTTSCNNYILSRLNFELGLYSLGKGLMDNAYSFFLKSLSLAKQSDNAQITAHSYYQLSNFEVEKGSHEKAIEYLLTAESVAAEIHARRLLRDIYNKLADVNTTIGFHDKAVHYQRLSWQTRENIFNESVVNNIRSIELASARKESENIIREKNEMILSSYTIVALIGLICILLFVIILLVLKSLQTSRAHKRLLEEKVLKRTAELRVKNNELVLSKEQLLIANQKIKIHSERENSLLLKEVSFIKSQFNSHITFNFLNYCYSKIHKLSEETADAIDIFSSMLRYSLAGRVDEKVPILTEIEYIDNFIKLQRLLTTQVFVEFSCKGDFNNKYILPRILIPFIENAFKHGKFDCPYDPIKILLSSFDDSINLTVTNKKNKRKYMLDTGVGRENVKNILQLYYPGRYNLIINEDENYYSCGLYIKIEYEEDQLHNSGRSAAVG